MSFPFPKNPVDGETVSHISSNGTLLLATYSASKNTWDVTRQVPPPPVTLARPGAQIPLATATGQVMTWDDTAKQWIASPVSLKTLDLLDVDHTQLPTNNSFLLYDGAAGKYRPVPISGNTVLQSNTVGLNVKLQAAGGNLNAALTEIYRQLNPTGVLKSGDAVVIKASPNHSSIEQYAGTYLYTGTDWATAAGGSGGAVAHYRDHATQVQEPGRKTGELDILTQPLDKQINVFDGTNYKLVLGEVEIKQWIAAGSLFQGTLTSDADLTALPAASSSNRGYYWTWTGSASHTVTNPLNAKLQVGDWIQSDGHKYIHVPSDLMSKQRWESVGSFRTWVDEDYEVGTLVVHNGKFYRATSPVSHGDKAPDVAGSFWQDLTPKFALENLTNVNDNVSAYGEDCILVWDEVAQEWTASKSMTIEQIEFDESGVGAILSGIASVNLDVPTAYDPDTWVPSVTAVKESINNILFEHLLDCGPLAAANNNDVPAWNSALSVWEPKPLKVSSLSAISDVDISVLPKEGEVLAWNELNHRWRPTHLGLGQIAGVDESARTDHTSLVYNPSNHKWEAHRLRFNELAGVWINGTPNFNQYLTWSNSGWTNAVITLDSLSNVSRTPPVAGQALIWNATTARWTPSNISTSLSGLSDVHLSTPAADNLLKFDGTKWTNWIPDFLNPTNAYTKSEVDSKVSALAIGIEHEEAVLDKLDTPPASPSVYDLYIVGPTPTGAWVGHANQLAQWNGTAWTFEAPKANEAHLVEKLAETWHWNGTAWVKVAVASTTSATSASAAELWVVGSIQQSLLTEAQWTSALGVAEAKKWVLADGRDVSGSKWATLTGQNRIPDLRGAFIRAAGQNNTASWNGGAVGSYHEDTTARPKNPFTTDTQGAHTHTYGKNSRQAKGGPDYNIVDGWDTDRRTSSDGAHSHTITGGGDVETAPKHFSLNTFIKVD